MAESFSVQAILSAVDKGFRSTMKDAKSTMESTADSSAKLSNELDKTSAKYDGAFQDKAGRWRTADGKFMTMKEKSEMLGNSFDETKQKSEKMNTSMMDIAKGVGVFKLVEAGVSAVKNSVGGAIARFDTLNKYPTVMEALGYSTDEVTASMDKLDKGIDGLPTSMDEIVASTQQIAIATGDLEKGTDTAIALNNAFLASGASSADASRGAEQYIQMLSKGEVDLQSWRTLQETMPIAMDKVAKSFEDRGVTSVNELYDALKEGDITFDEFNDRMLELNEGVGGFADLAEKNSKGIATSFKNIRTAVVKGVEKTIRAIDEALQGAGLGSIADIIDNAKELVNDFFGFIIDITPTVIETIMGIVEVLKKLSPILVPLIAVIATYQGITGGITRAVKLWVGAQKLLTAVMAVNPFVLFISVIVVLVGWIIYMWKTNEGFRNAIIEIWTAIKDFFANLWGNMKATATKFWQDTKDTAIETFTGMRDGLKEIWDSTKQFFVDIWNGIKEFATGLWDGMKEKASEIFNGMKDTLSETWTKTKDKSSEIWTNTKEKASEIWGNTKTSVVTIAGNLKDDVLTAWDGMKTGTSKAMSKVKKVLKSLGEIDLFQVGKDVINGFIDGIKNMISDVKDAISNVASTVTDGLKGALKIKSPSRVMMGISKWIPAGVAKGIEDNTKQVDKAMANMVDTDLVNPIADDLNNAFTSVGKTSLSNEMNINHSNQPAYINLSLGGQNFKAFVDNIGSTMGQEADLLAQY